MVWKICKSTRESKNVQTAMTLGFYKFPLSEHILFATPKKQKQQIIVSF